MSLTSKTVATLLAASCVALAAACSQDHGAVVAGSAPVGVPEGPVADAGVRKGLDDGSASSSETSTPDKPSPTPKTYTTVSAIVHSKADLAASLFPIAVGLLWTYDVHNGITTCTPGPRTIRYRSKKMVGTREEYALDPLCDYFGDGADAVWVEGDAVFSSLATNAAPIILQPPLVDGAGWNNGAVVVDTLVRENGPVTVAAGTFSDCWTVHSVPWTSDSTYCRGVGLVRMVSTTSGPGDTGFGVELTGFDFSALP